MKPRKRFKFVAYLLKQLGFTILAGIILPFALVIESIPDSYLYDDK